MAIIADVKYPKGALDRDIYISPSHVQEDTVGGHYTLKYRRGGKGGDELQYIWPERQIIPFLGNTQRFSTGVRFDREQPGRKRWIVFSEQVPGFG